MTQEEQLQNENSQQQEQLNAVVDSNDHNVEKKNFGRNEFCCENARGKAAGSCVNQLIRSSETERENNNKGNNWREKEIGRRHGCDISLIYLYTGRTQ